MARRANVVAAAGRRGALPLTPSQPLPKLSLGPRVALAMALALASALPVLGGCLSSRPPAPPVRWFDPTPRPSGEVEELVVPVVTADPRVRQEFVLRVAPRELVIDEAHRWVAAPDRLVAAALARELGAGASAGSAAAAPVRVHVQRFELVLFETPHAVVELLVTAPSGVHPCVGTARATDTTPEALAEAMAQALATAAATCREQFVRR